jgi:hypothetical protein
VSERLDRVIAYVDGETDAATRKTFEAEMAADPTLAAQVAAHRDLARSLAAAYAPVAAEPVPERLRFAAMTANDATPRRHGLAWAGMAACLVIGVVAGRATLTPPVQIGVGAEVPARTDLARALDDRLASEPGVVRIGLSFRDRAGRYCRTFQSRGDGVAGLACRDGPRWRLETATRWTAAKSPDYRTAGSDTPPEVLAAVDRSLAGEALDATQERAARDAGWR